MGRKIRIVGLLIVLLAILFVGTGCNSSSSDSGSGGSSSLKFAIWDIGQQPGMEAIVEAYRQSGHENVNIEVQVTNWNEYWTKLEAGVTSHTAPDIFWMHPTYLLDYTDAGILADTTDIVNQSDFPETALTNCKGSNGQLYGVPKDKDTIGLVYSYELFDKAGVAYPTEDWTWTDMEKASEQIYEKTGKYGFMAYADEQLGYYPFVYQNGGYIVNDDRTAGGFDQEGTRKAVEYYVNLQKNDWCPDQNYFAQNSPGDSFFSGNGAMFIEGSWNMYLDLQNYPEMDGKWNVQVLPKAPDPVEGDGRATISNSLAYATTADNKNLDTVLDFLEFCGTEEAQAIQGNTGTAIPAYNGLEHTWVDFFKNEGYSLDVQKFIDMFDYAKAMPNDKSRPSWRVSVNSKLLQMYNGDLEYEEGLDQMNELINDAMAEY